MKKIIFGLTVAALFVASAFSQNQGTHDYTALAIGAKNGGTSIISGASTNNYLITLDKHDKYTFVFQGIVKSATNYVGASNTLTLRFYDRITAGVTNASAAFTKAITVDTNHVSQFFTNVTVDCVGYQILSVENPGSIITNAYLLQVVKPKRSGG